MFTFRGRRDTSPYWNKVPIKMRVQKVLGSREDLREKTSDQKVWKSLLWQLKWLDVEGKVIPSVVRPPEPKNKNKNSGFIFFFLCEKDLKGKKSLIE